MSRDLRTCEKMWRRGFTAHNALWGSRRINQGEIACLDDGRGTRVVATRNLVSCLHPTFIAGM